MRYIHDLACGWNHLWTSWLTEIYLGLKIFTANSFHITQHIAEKCRREYYISDLDYETKNKWVEARLAHQRDKIRFHFLFRVLACHWKFPHFMIIRIKYSFIIQIACTTSYTTPFNKRGSHMKWYGNTQEEELPLSCWDLAWWTRFFVLMSSEELFSVALCMIAPAIAKWHLQRFNIYGLGTVNNCCFTAYSITFHTFRPPAGLKIQLASEHFERGRRIWYGRTDYADIHHWLIVSWQNGFLHTVNVRWHPKICCTV